MASNLGVKREAGAAAPDASDTGADSDVARLIRSRRTIHEFEPQAPPQSKVLEAIDLARWAPNHHATEPWRFYLLGSETIAAIVELNAQIVERKSGPEAAWAKHARWSAIPGWLVVTCERSDDATRSREDYAACCCAIQNLQLYLWSEGIGVKWTTGAVTRDPAFYDILWIDPECETLVGMLWYGYAREVPMVARKSVPEILVTLP